MATARKFSAARRNKVLSAKRALPKKRRVAELHRPRQQPDRPPVFFHGRSASMHVPRFFTLHDRDNCGGVFLNVQRRRNVFRLRETHKQSIA